MATYVIDYSWARPDPAAIRRAGYTGVLRYVSRPDSNGKNITRGELDRLRAAGLDVTLNFEQSERRPLDGRSAGETDARSADALADKVGYPRGCAIYYSVDFAATWTAVREYFRGVKAASHRPVGIYAGLPLCHAAMDEGLATYGWITNAASWSGLHAWSQVQAAAAHSRCHLLQHLHSNTPAHIDGSRDIDFDPNTVLRPSYGQWGDNVHEEDDMFEDADRLLLNALAIALVGDHTDPKAKPHNLAGKIDWLIGIAIPGGWENRGKATPRLQTVVALLTAERAGENADPKELAKLLAENIGPELGQHVIDELKRRLEA